MPVGAPSAAELKLRPLLVEVFRALLPGGGPGETCTCVALMGEPAEDDDEAADAAAAGVTTAALLEDAGAALELLDAAAGCAEAASDGAGAAGLGVFLKKDVIRLDCTGVLPAGVLALDDITVADLNRD